ncbi:pantoate--beta-alanine ligase, partial [Pseudomonas syringae]
RAGASSGEEGAQERAWSGAVVRVRSWRSQRTGGPTVGADAGLARASRDGYLSGERRAAARALYQAIRQTADAIRAGEQEFDALLASKRQQLEAAGFRVDYLAIRAATSLRPTTAEHRDLVILAAALPRKTRSTDNLHRTSR